MLCRESEHYYCQAFSVNQTTQDRPEHEYAEITAYKTKADVIECETLSLKSIEYEDIAACRKSVATNAYEFTECPAYMTTVTTQKEIMSKHDIHTCQ